MKLVIPEAYKSNEDLYRTQVLIKEIKDYFQINLANNLNLKGYLHLFLYQKSGLNDNLMAWRNLFPSISQRLIMKKWRLSIP